MDCLSGGRQDFLSQHKNFTSEARKVFYLLPQHLPWKTSFEVSFMNFKRLFFRSLETSDKAFCLNILLFWREAIRVGNKRRAHKSVEIFDLLSSFLMKAPHAPSVSRTPARKDYLADCLNRDLANSCFPVCFDVALQTLFLTAINDGASNSLHARFGF
jgi:hypothetical protein